VTVKTAGKPVPGAAVSGHVERPDGGSDALSFADAGGGEYKASYTLEKSFPEGTYKIKVNAKKGISEGTGEGSFDFHITTIRGLVTDGHTDSFGKKRHLVGVPVTLTWDGVDLPTVYTNAVGCYEIKHPSIVLGTQKEGVLELALIDKDKTIKIVETFAGIGEQNKAFKNIEKKKDLKIQSVGISEWYIDALIAYAKTHHLEEFNNLIETIENQPQDIKKGVIYATNKNLIAKIVSIDGQAYDGSELARLASLPTRDQGISMIMALMLAPVGKLARTLVALKEQREVGAESTESEAEVVAEAAE